MKTAHVLFFISLVGASSAFVFTSPLLPSSKNVYQTPLLLEAKEIVNEKERSENGVNAKTYGEIKDILLLNISPEEKAKLIARRIENEQDLTAKEVAKERNINRELIEKNKEENIILTP